MSNNIRQPITEDKKARGKQIRKKIGKGLKLDVSKYEAKYPDSKLMLISDYGNDVHEWLDRGAEPVPIMTDERKTFKGINDKRENGWVTFSGGKDKSGKEYLLYLLMIDPDIYDDYKTGPERERQEEIEKAMKLGANASDLSAHLPGGGGMQTYAPNLPVGDGAGYNEIKPAN